MKELESSFEGSPQLQLFQVVLAPGTGGLCRTVIVQFLDGYAGTSQIIDEGLPTERLAHAGSTLYSEIQPTDEFWQRSRVIEGLINTVGKDTPQIRAAYETLIAK